MKRLNYFLLGLTVLGMALFASCGDEETTDQLPTLNFKGGSAYVSSNTTLTAGQAFTIGITATPNVTSEEKLVQLTVTRTFNNVPTTVVDTALDKVTSFSADIELYANEGIGDERFLIEVEDDAGQVASLELTITTETGAIPLKSFTAVLLAGQSRLDVGSYLDADAGDVYLKADALDNDDKIDIIYFYGTTNLATLVAPDDATVNGGPGNLTLAVDLSPKNETRFNLNPGITETEFDAMTDDSDITGLSMSGSIANQLNEGDVIAFKTASDRIGLIKVVSITTGGDGEITIDVKIQ